MTKEYFKWLFCTFITVIISTAIINYIIDPYSIFRTLPIQGLNTSKPATSSRTALAKAYMINDFNAETLIVGTSSFDVGIDPQSSYLPDHFRPAFNLAIPGAGVYKQFRYIQHAVSQYKPKLIIMSLEFQNFLYEDNNPHNNISDLSIKSYENRLNVTYTGELNSEKYYQYIKDFSASLLSITATLDSLHTILAGDTQWITQSGLSSGFTRFGKEITSKGHYSVFRDVLNNHMTSIAGKKISRISPSIRALKDTIRFCQKNNIELILILPPYHVFVYQAWDYHNIWAEFEYWKQLVLQTTEAVRNEHSSNVSILDFATYNEYTMENVPPKLNNKMKMNWFWEPLHFKKTLGDMVIESIFKSFSNDDLFGISLENTNFCDHIRNNRGQKNLYVESNREQVELLMSILSNQSYIDSSQQEKMSILCQIRL